jgi:hypothetical protein
MGVLLHLTLAATLGLDVQEPPPRPDVRGVVVDSTAHRPLVGARVVLWGTRYEATSDERGRFRIEAVPPGDYSVAFFHPRLAELGVAAGGRPITLGVTDVEVELGVPSRFTLLVVSCAGAGGVAVAGRAFDESSGVSLGGVTVGFQWMEADGSIVRRSVRTGEAGWYHACALAAGATVAISASVLDRQSLRREVAAPEGSSVRLDLPLAPRRPSEVSATVVDAGTRMAVPDAVVKLGVSGGERLAVSDGSGRVSFEAVPPGHYTVSVEHLTRATRTDSVDVPSGADVELRIEVAQEPIPLPPLEVSVDAFEEVMGFMGGTAITSAQIDAVRERSRDLGDLLRNQHIPGVIVSRDFTGRVCVEFLNGQVNMFKDACEPMMVVLDGVRVGVARDVFTMPAAIIEQLRLFRPVEAGALFGLGSSNGVLVITTKSRN